VSRGYQVDDARIRRGASRGEHSLFAADGTGSPTAYRRRGSSRSVDVEFGDRPPVVGRSCLNALDVLRRLRPERHSDESCRSRSAAIGLPHTGGVAVDYSIATTERQLDVATTRTGRTWSYLARRVGLRSANSDVSPK
jgi:hypothetical protein